jgi:hypothetical protein
MNQQDVTGGGEEESERMSRGEGWQCVARGGTNRRRPRLQKTMQTKGLGRHCEQKQEQELGQEQE